MSSVPHPSHDFAPSADGETTRCRYCECLEISYEADTPCRARAAPVAMKTSRCRSCDAEIVWLKTATGKNMPVDASTVTEGDDKFNPEKHVSHFATCPFAKQHRRRP